MLEIVPSEAVIVACHGQPAALDGLPDALGLVLRIAPDEAWLVAPRTRRAGLLRSAALWLESADPTGLVVDQTDGWAVYLLRGDGVEEVFGRLSVVPVAAQRPAFIQGALSGVPGKAVVTDDALYLMVPSPVGHHLEARIGDTCSDLGVKLGAPAPFSLGVRAAVGKAAGTAA